MNATEFVSIPEAATLLGVSRQAVWQAIKQGRMAAIRVGRDYIIRRPEVEKYQVSEEMRRRRLGVKKKKG